MYRPDVVGAFLPGEDARRHDPVEANLGKRGEELVPVHLALADVHVLVDGDLRPGRVADVAQARRRFVIVSVSDVDMRDERARVAHHLGNVVAEVERVRRAIEELNGLGPDHLDHVDGRMKRLAPVLRMRFDVELDALLFEHGHELLHRAPPGGFARFMSELTAAAVGRVPPVGRGATAELGVHRIDAHLDCDLDRLLPVAHRGLALVLVRTCPTVHRQQRGDLHAVILERFLKARDAFGVGARMDPPGEEIVARRHLDPLVTELGDLAWQLLQRQVSVHVRIESDFHGTTPSVKRSGAARDRAKPFLWNADHGLGGGRGRQTARCQRAPALSRIHPAGGGG